MKLVELLDLIDDESWVRIECARCDGGKEITIWLADWVGGDKEISDRIAPLLEQDVLDIYPENMPTVIGPIGAPGIVIPLAPRRYELVNVVDNSRVEWTVDEILEEINRDRSGEWQDYDYSDWREGLETFTEYRLEPGQQQEGTEK